MQLLDDHLWSFYQRSMISAEEMIDKSKDPVLSRPRSTAKAGRLVHRMGRRRFGGLTPFEPLVPAANRPSPQFIRPQIPTATLFDRALQPVSGAEALSSCIMWRCLESETTFKAIPPSEMKGRRIGRIFVKMQLVKREQVSKALAVQKERAESGQNVKVGEVLRELGFVTDHHISYALAGQAGLQLVDLDPEAVPAEAIDALPAETATSYQIAPVSFDAGSNRLVVALKSPDNFQAIDNLRLLLNFDAVAVIADPAAIDQIIAKHYANQSSGAANLDFGSEELSALEGRGDSVDLEDLVQAAGSSAVVRLINMVLMQAIRDKASDIHLEPFEDEFKMRYRIDGVLYEMSLRSALGHAHCFSGQSHVEFGHCRAAASRRSY